jgi:hypothetical protein
LDVAAKSNEIKTQELQSTLTQTELDLANAVLLIQEKDAELAQFQSLVTAQSPALALTDADADNANSLPLTTANAGFGTKFPTTPQKGDMFLRVDMLPNKLFKWNGQKWIATDKTTTDRYAYEEEYIQYLLSKIRSREYTMDDLSPAERDQIMDRLNYQEKTKL